MQMVACYYQRPLQLTDSQSVSKSVSLTVSLIVSLIVNLTARILSGRKAAILSSYLQGAGVAPVNSDFVIQKVSQ